MLILLLVIDHPPSYASTDGEQTTHKHAPSQRIDEEGHLVERLQGLSIASESTIAKSCATTVVSNTDGQLPIGDLTDVERDIVVKSEWLARVINDHDSDDGSGGRTSEAYSISASTPCSERSASLSTEPSTNTSFTPEAHKEEKQIVPHVAQPKPFPILLSVPVADGDTALKSLEELHSDTRNSLQRRYKDMCSATKLRRERYVRIEKGPLPYSKKSCCVRDAINRSTC